MCGLTFRYLAVVEQTFCSGTHTCKDQKMELTALRELLKKHRLTDKDINRQVNVNNLERTSHFCYKQWKSLPSHLGVHSNVVGEIDKTHKDEKTKCLNFLLWWNKGSCATYKQLLTALLSIKCEQAAEMLCTRLKESGSDSLQPQLPPARSSGTSDDEPPRSKTGNFRLQLVAWVSWRDTIHGRSLWNFHTQGFLTFMQTNTLNRRLSVIPTESK